MALQMSVSLVTHAINSADQQKNSNKSALIPALKSDMKIQSDNVCLIGIAQCLSESEKEFYEYSEFDTSRVKEIKKSVNDGNFNVNPLRVAEKFIIFECALKR